jgi:16S rRNA (cytosine967-C5)-methyltransferase
MDERSQPAVVRAAAAEIVVRVQEGRYLDALLDEVRARESVLASQAPLLQELAYGTLRWFHQLKGIARLFLLRPLGRKDADIDALLLVGLYQLRYMRVPPHAAVDATVAAAETLGKSWAKSLLNACLRSYLRENERANQTVDASAELHYSHPTWLLQAMQRDYPNEWRRILDANNERPPMALRVNTNRISRDKYLAQLERQGIAARSHHLVDAAVVLDTPMPVDQLPGFREGWVSVQDAGAQLAAVLLDVPPGARVLDACAAPGGKAAHVFERTPALGELVALDIDSERLDRMQNNFARLGVRARCICADAAEPSQWRHGETYDRILLDVPCSATGVIRRHPDIKVRRTPAELELLRRTQTRIFDGVWPSLARGGKLLYATCSVLSEENDLQIRDFVARHPDATAEALAMSGPSPGRRILPGDDEMDGFYYARLRKQ